MIPDKHQPNIAVTPQHAVLHSVKPHAFQAELPSLQPRAAAIDPICFPGQCNPTSQVQENLLVHMDLVTCSMLGQPAAVSTQVFPDAGDQKENCLRSKTDFSVATVSDLHILTQRARSNSSAGALKVKSIPSASVPGMLLNRPKAKLYRSCDVASRHRAPLVLFLLFSRVRGCRNPSESGAFDAM